MVAFTLADHLFIILSALVSTHTFQQTYHLAGVLPEILRPTNGKARFIKKQKNKIIIIQLLGPNSA